MSGCGRGHGRLVDVVVVTMVVAGLVDAVGVVAVTIALVDVVVVVVTVGCVAVAGCVVTIGFVAVAGGLLPIGFGAVAVVVVTIGLVEGDGLVRVVGGKGAGIEAVVVLGERVLVVAPLAVVVPAGVDAAAVIVGAVGLATVGAVAGSGWGETNLWGVSLRPVVVIRCVLFVAELAGAGLTRPAWRSPVPELKPTAITVPAASASAAMAPARATSTRWRDDHGVRPAAACRRCGVSAASWLTRGARLERAVSARS